MTLAGALAMRGQTEGALIGCIREFQNSLDDSVYSLLVSEIIRLNIPGYKILSNRIVHKPTGGGMRFRGLSRSIDAIKSMHNFKYFWLEEGQFMSQESIRTLTPTLRTKDSELWISANPGSSADPFSQRFLVPYQKELNKYGVYEDDLHYIVKVNYYDNPWFPDVLKLERANDELYLPAAMYDHVWEGAYNDSVEDSIISTKWFDAAVDAHIKLGFKPYGAITVAHDPSDLGTDDKGYCLRRGSVILDVQARAFGEVNDGADWALDLAIENGADLFVWDCDGLGLGLKKQVAKAIRGKSIQISMFKGSEGPENPNQIYKPLSNTNQLKHKDKKNKQVFKNKRAQRYWHLRDRFLATYLAVEKGVYTDPDNMISISSKIEDLVQLRSEICRIPRKFNSSGMIQILSKAEMRAKKIASPNMSDAVMMSLETPEMYDDDDDLNFDTFY